MTYKIVATTDGRYIGREFDEADNPIQLAVDVSVPVDVVIDVPGGKRFASSNYIIDAVEV